jgi:hypothetical protein
MKKVVDIFKKVYSFTQGIHKWGKVINLLFDTVKFFGDGLQKIYPSDIPAIVDDIEKVVE